MRSLFWGIFLSSKRVKKKHKGWDGNFSTQMQSGFYGPSPFRQYENWVSLLTTFDAVFIRELLLSSYWLLARTAK
jgi:hypothetical protein